EELHDRLLELVVLPPDPTFADWFAALVADGRAASTRGAPGPLWLAAEQRPLVAALFPERPIEPDVRLPAALRRTPPPDAAVAAYRPEWLDELCLSGEVVWARLAPRGAQAMGTPLTPAESPGRGGLGPSRATPVSFIVRDNLPWLLRAARGGLEPLLPGPGAARDILECLRAGGALFYHDVVRATGRLHIEVEE